MFMAHNRLSKCLWHIIDYASSAKTTLIDYLIIFFKDNRLCHEHNRLSTIFFPHNRLWHMFIFSDNRLRMKLNSHSSPEVTNKEPSALTTLSKFSRYVLCEEPNCLCFVSLGTTYILLHLFITLIHPLTNLPMHSLSFELGQTDSWTMVRNLMCLLLKSFSSQMRMHASCTMPTYIQKSSEGTNDISLILLNTHSLTLSFLCTSECSLIWPNFPLTLTHTLNHDRIQTGVAPHIRLQLLCHPPIQTRAKYKKSTPKYLSTIFYFKFT